MSSSTRTPTSSRRPRRSALFLLVVATQLIAAMSAACAQPEPEIAVVAQAADGRIRLAVHLREVGDQRQALRSFSTTVNGVSQPTTVEPVMSDRLAMGIVVDASVAGEPVLQAGVSGLANFVLAAPASIRSALAADTTPPDLLAPLEPGPIDTLRALAALRPRGDRQTSAAIDLGLRQLPPDAAEPRVVVLYTAAPDAGGEPAADLGERLKAAGALLAVVTTAGDGRAVPRYWSTVAAATGGIVVSARTWAVIPAFDRLAAELGTRYLLTTPAPDRLPATLTVRVDTASGPRTVDVVVPAPGPRGGMGSDLRLPVTLAGAVLVLVTIATAVTAALRVPAAEQARRVISGLAARRRGYRRKPDPTPVRSMRGSAVPIRRRRRRSRSWS